MLPDKASSLLAHAFAEILGAPETGSMAYVRCLPPGALRELAANPAFAVDGWRLAAVVETQDPEHRMITADQAVEWREEKQEASLVLVDHATAGAGMDGIYSAAREIGEAALFDKAHDLARAELPHGYKGFARKVLAKARTAAQHHILSPWRAFIYLCRGLEDTRALGSALPEIGLWPVDFGDKPQAGDLDRVARLTERLLPLQGTRISAEERVAALRLGAGEEQTEQRLSDFLREVERLPLLEALGRVADEQAFWLNRMNPGLFDAQALQDVEWVTWRGRTGKPLAWSGLSENKDKRLEWRLNPGAENPQQRSRLEVRWRVVPDSLAKGALDYVVEIRAGHDVLAAQNVSQSGKSPQKTVFTQDDLDNLEESARFEAQVVISALGDDPRTAESEDFVLCFGESDKPPKESSGRIYPTLALAAVHMVPDWEGFKTLAKEPGNREFFGRDAKGYVTCRWQGKVGRVFCPPLLTRLTDDWVARNGALGRWRQRIRADGTAVGEAEFVPMAPDAGGERLAQASRQFANWLADTQGPLAILYQYEDSATINGYVLAALSVWENTAPELTLVQTLEVQSLSGRRLGLIVLPTHPLRVAWQQGYDLLAAYHRYHKANEEKLSAHKIEHVLKRITGAHCPAFLPGLSPDESFVFADTLGLHAAALVLASDPEPKATVALLARLFGDDETAAPTVGLGAAAALGDEVRRYLQLHPAYRRIQVHALRAGDAMPVARALGRALTEAEENDVTPWEAGEHHPCYELDLYPAAGQATELTGRFLSATAERRRSGAGAVPEEDRWLLESVARPGGVSLPRLRWARRSTPIPSTPAHMALAFDILCSRVESRAPDSLPSHGVLETHGLALMPTREFYPGPTPHWLSFIPPNPQGEKHPFTRMLTDRQAKLHATVLRATARHLGGGPNDWPVVVTEMSPDQADSLGALHSLCDWVITADRHAGVEYFDSPRSLPQVYERYIIDCVPEREDLGFLQLITSTSSFDEVVGLLDVALGEMGLSTSPSNCRFLLDALRAVSGRLALRLSGNGSTAQEMVAVALVHSHCNKSTEGDEVWLPLRDGFFVPLDDVPELFRQSDKTPQVTEQRADLLYVRAPKRGALRLMFIEVKFRRYLKTARAPELVETIEGQIHAACQRWEQLFGPGTSTLEQTVNRAWLARILRFYARKGRRHTLSEEAFQRVMREIDRMVQKEVEPPALENLGRLGYVFCPEYGGNRPARIDHGSETQLWLFGPDTMPEPRGEAGSTQAPDEPFVEPPTTVAPIEEHLSGETASGEVERSDADSEESEGAGEAEVMFGYRSPGGDPVTWNVSIRANPHLMILGLPGMGKTTCLINLCRQLEAQAVTPIVFSYHQDIDEKLAAQLREPPLPVRYAGLGFNPLRVEGESPIAHLDTVGMLRDIFAAIFPELGDIQLGYLREALKQSYSDQGWGPGQKGEVPAFHTFLDLLRSAPKPDKGLLLRLNELDDYGLFDAGHGAPTLLDASRAALIEIHGTQNEHLQRAFATFVLYNLYQNMFRRGPQQRITHAVIFDEAHRAAKLKLIPTMVKECRKYGIAFVVASQEAKDFDPSLFTAVANYLALRLVDADAKLMAKIFAASDRVGLHTDRIKQMPKYQGTYYGEGLRTPISVALANEVPLKR